MADTYLNVAEAAQRRGPKGNLLLICELLAQINDIMKDAPMVQANDVYSHQENVRTKLPTVGPRNINEGGSRSSSTTKKIIEPIMLLEVFADMDEQVIDHEPDKKKAMRNEIQSFLEAAMQEFTRIFFYGNPGVDSRECTGLWNREDWDAAADPYVYDVGGDGDDCTSVLMIEWGERAAKLIYPRDVPSVGVQENWLGKIRVYDSNVGPYMAYSEQIKMEFGISVPNPRCVQRISSIDTATLGTNDLLASNAMRVMSQAKNQLPLFGKNAVVYGNRTTKTQFDIYAMEKANGFYMMKNITGEPLASYQGIPIHLAEQLVDTEAAL